MITLKDILSKQEMRDTKWVLKQTKDKFGYDEYILFKKMATVVGLIYGLEGYLSYGSFIGRAKKLIDTNLSSTQALGFMRREDTSLFFGQNVKFIKESTYEEVREHMIKVRQKMLDNEEFPLDTGPIDITWALFK